MRTALTFLLCLLPGAFVSADSLGIGNPLPTLHVDDRGELLLEGEEFDYAPWTLPATTDKLHVLQYMAGTMGASKLNEPFTDRLQELPQGGFHVTTVVNLGDALWGTKGFVVSEVKKSKRKFPESTMVLDEDSVGPKTWNIQNDSSAIVIIGTDGLVRYLKDGPMSEAEIESALELVRTHSSSSAP